MLEVSHAKVDSRLNAEYARSRQQCSLRATRLNTPQDSVVNIGEPLCLKVRYDHLLSTNVFIETALAHIAFLGHAGDRPDHLSPAWICLTYDDPGWGGESLRDCGH